jgi:hypothetical protein
MAATSSLVRNVRRLFGLVLMMAALSACQRAEYRHQYWLSHAGQRIPVSFNPAAVDPYTAAAMGVNTCDAILVRNGGSAAVMIDVFVFAVGKVNQFGDLEQEIKVLIRNSPRPEAPAMLAPLGDNVVVTGQWGVSRTTIKPGRESYTCVDNFPNLRNADYGISLRWL